MTVVIKILLSLLKEYRDVMKKYLAVSTAAYSFHPIFLEIHKALLGNEFLDIEVIPNPSGFDKLIKITYETSPLHIPELDEPT